MCKQMAEKIGIGASRAYLHGVIVLLVVTTALAIAGALGGCSQANIPVQAQTPPPFSIAYIATWGVKGGDPGQLEQPTDIATDTLGNIYLADAGTALLTSSRGKAPAVYLRRAGPEISAGNHRR